jgi:hypothetical protein
MPCRTHGLAHVLVAWTALEACSGGPAEFPPALKDPASDLDTVLDAARGQPLALLKPEAEPALQRLGSELRSSVDQAAELVAAATAAAPASGTPAAAPEAATQAAQRAGRIVGLLERVFRCAENSDQVERDAVNRAAAKLYAAAGAQGTVPELPEGTDPLQWAQSQRQAYQLATPLVRLAAAMPVSLASAMQTGRNRSVMEPCR